MNSVQALYQKIEDPVKASKEVGIWVARSGICGPNVSAETGAIIALDAFAKCIPITDFPLKYNVIGGRMTMKPETMLAGFHELGGKHKIIQSDSEACVIQLSIGDECETFSITWEDAQKEPWPYGKDGKKLKPTWAGIISRTDMLWARTVSRAVRKLRPQVTAGMYTPEEIQDLPEYAESLRGESQSYTSQMPDADLDAILKGAVSGVNGASVANGTNGEVKKPALPPKPAASTDGNDNDAQKAVPSTPQDSTQDTFPPAIATSSDKSEDGFATASQTSRISELFAALSVPLAAQKKALAKRNVTALRSLTFDQASELLATLEAKHTSQPSFKTDAACTQSQVEGIERIVKELNDDDPKFDAQFRERLAALGKSSVGELSIHEADAVFSALTMDEMSSFFEVSLMRLVKDREKLVAT